MPLAPLVQPFQEHKSGSDIAPLCSYEEDSDYQDETDGIGEIEVQAEDLFTSGDKVQATDFQLLQILGQGSFGKVYLVRKISGDDAGTLYAMKVLKKASLKIRDQIRTKMERNILAAIDHPFIVKLHYAFQTEGKLYIILEFVRGGDLFGRLSREIMFTETDVKFYLAELALAIDHLHKLGIIYRDLKPENILLDHEGHIKITDFGLSKESIFEEDDKRTFSFCGTVEYMAPEVINRRGHGTASDWWSYGVLLFEMLTGTLPFQGSNRKETMSMILKAKLGMPQFLSSEAQSLLRNLFKRNPQNRLGYGNNGIAELKTHQFFAKFDWDLLYQKKIKPPFRPSVPNLDEIYRRSLQHQAPIDSPAALPSASAKELFRGFSYVAPTVNLEEMKDLKIKSQPNMKKEPFSNYYFLREVIGRGTYSACHRCTHKFTKVDYAVKIIDKNSLKRSEEIEVLSRFGHHPNIVTLYDVYEQDEKVYIVTQYLKGGELLDMIIARKSFSEREACEVIEVICRIVDYLHSNGVVHRDLKPSNILYAEKTTDPSTLTLCDFGFARIIRAENGLLMTPCYTANYVAPEVLKKQGYDKACDIWSIGVIMYTLISGRTPFAQGPKDTAEVILKRIGDHTIEFSAPVWRLVTPSALDLLKKMLHIDPSQRISSSQILKHPWIEKRYELSTNNLIAPQDIEAVKTTVRATFTAANAHSTPALKPVSSSIIAQRRGKQLKTQV